MRKATTLLWLVCFILLMRVVLAQETPRTLYVLNGLGRTVSKMNLETLEISNDIVVVGEVPNRIFADDEKVYVVNSSPAGITIIDGSTDQIINNISLTEGSNPWSMAFVGGNKAYVTNLFANSVTVVNLVTGDSLNTIQMGVAPEGILVLDDFAYVTNTGGFPDYSPSTVSVIDIRTDSVTKTVDVAPNPQELTLAPDGKIHVVCTGNFGDIGGKVYIIDPSGDSDGSPAVADSVLIGGSPNDIVITSDGLAYLADFGDGNNGFVYSYDISARAILHDASNPILVGKGAMNLLFDDENGALYVNNFSDDAVQQLDASNGSVIHTFGFGDGTQDMAILGSVNPTSVEDGSRQIPSDFALFQNYPNPFNPETRIEFSISRNTRVQITIFNIKGEPIRKLVDKTFAAGKSSMIWDGKDEIGRIAPSGIYLYEMKAGDVRIARRLTVLR